jgi:hypothetical protein
LERSTSKRRVLVWARSLIALALIWSIAAGVVVFLRSKKPTASEVIRLLRQQDVAKLPAGDRDKVLRDAARQLNRLSFYQMREVKESRALFAFYRPLTPTEKEQFAELIVPTGLRRILDASRDVPPNERAKFLRNALYYAVIDLSTANPPVDPKALERIEQAALRSYLNDLSAEERKAMEPQLKQIHEYLHP